ncbi:MAG: single-stranded DNA-binding protein [Oscillospiraceae bacterium]
MYNKVIIMGRFTADPELKKTSNDISVTNFSLAVQRSFVPEGGERQTDFLDCVAWRQTAEFIHRFFTKGKPILVEGSIQVREYTDKEGQKRKAWEIVVDNAYFTESKATDRDNDDQQDATE